jgi:Cu/Ag efflux pump CusA
LSASVGFIALFGVAVLNGVVLTWLEERWFRFARVAWSTAVRDTALPLMGSSASHDGGEK